MRYKWSIQNIEDLLSDITNAITDAERYRQGFKYRVGTIILHKNDDGVYDVVDGQQRIISLTPSLRATGAGKPAAGVVKKSFLAECEVFCFFPGYGQLPAGL
ncbi:MAG: DUF262 domain-containing protein [Acetatifactor sp.]|nr:DUF262 domain-containing protein [Acetatifactor sp.]